MTIAELIEKLQQIQEENGDIEVAVDGTRAVWVEVCYDTKGNPFVEIG